MPTHESWMQSSIDNAKAALSTGMAIFNNKEQAIKYARSATCAGAKAFSIALIEYFGENPDA